MLPQNLTNEYGNNAVTSLADGEAVVWKTVYLNGTHEQNKAKIETLNGDDQYVKIVMQTDWDCPEYMNKCGNVEKMIWDLNGHTFHLTKSISLTLEVKILEITDSSAAGNGLMQSFSRGSTMLNFAGTNLILSGGTIKGYTDLQHGANLVMTGGNLINYGEDTGVATIILNSDSSQNGKLYFAPYIKATPVTPDKTWSNPMLYNPETSFEWRTQTNTSNAAFAISKSDIWCGAYNYAYGVAWNLAAGDCLLEHLTEKRPYYLWARNSNHEWYNLLAAVVL